MPTLHYDGMTKRVACGSCIKGHRSSKCLHLERPLIEIRKSGRPMVNCSHLKENESCTCTREQVFVLVGGSPQCDGPDGAITNVKLADNQVEYPKSRAVAQRNAKRLSELLAEDEASSSSDGQPNGESNGTKAQSAGTPPRNESPRRATDSPVGQLVAEQNGGSTPTGEHKTRLRLGLMGVGGFRAGPDPIGWDGSWPSRDDSSSDDAADSHQSKKRCCQKSIAQFQQMQAESSWNRADRKGSNIHQDYADSILPNGLAEGNPSFRSPFSQHVHQEGGDCCGSGDIKTEHEPFLFASSQQPYPDLFAADMPAFNFLTPIQAVSCPPNHNSIAVQSDAHMDATAGNRLLNNNFHGDAASGTIFASDGLSTPPSLRSSEGCICRPEECLCVNCAKHANNPHQREYFKYFWELQGSPDYIAEEERLQRSQERDETLIGNTSMPFAAASTPGFGGSSAQQYTSQMPQSADFPSTGTGSADSSPTLPGAWHTTNQSKNMNVSAATTALHGPSATPGANIDAASKMRRLAETAFSSEAILIQRTDAHAELLLRPIPNTDGVFLDPQHLHDMRIVLYYDGLVLEDGLRNRAQVVDGRLRPLHKTASGEFEYLVPVVPDGDVEAAVQKVDTGIFKFSPSLDDPGLSRDVAAQLRRS